MNQNTGDAERIGYRAGMLATGAAEATERVAGHVIAALHGDMLDGIGHVLHGDGQKPVRDLLRRPSGAGRGRDLLRQRGKFHSHCFAVKRLVLVRAEDRRKEVRLQLAHHDIAIGDGERTAAPITGRTGVGSSRMRTYSETRSVESENGTAAG